jgi:hypothetical protein
MNSWSDGGVVTIRTKLQTAGRKHPAEAVHYRSKYQDLLASPRAQAATALTADPSLY